MVPRLNSISVNLYDLLYIFPPLFYPVAGGRGVSSAVNL